MANERRARAEALRALHHAPRPLILPNAWDVASARIVTGAGFGAVATSSHAVAASLGYPDTDSMPAETAFAVVARIAGAVDVPVTADLEAGYGLTANEFVERLLAVGAVGCNLEDTDHHGPDVLKPVEVQAEWLRAVREAATEAGVPIVINARVDVFLRQVGDPAGRLEEALRRGRAYREVGADCVYPIGLTDAETIAAFVRAMESPVNIWLRPDAPPLRALIAMGVKRISLAGGLFNAALAAMRRTVEELQQEAEGTEP